MGRFLRAVGLVPAALAWLSLGLACVEAKPVHKKKAVGVAGNNRVAPRSGLGPGNSAASVAKKRGFTATPSQIPPTFALAPGVALTVNYTGEFAANPIGGTLPGNSDYAGQVFVGLDFDLQRLANIDGGSVHFAMTQRHGNNLAADYIGNNTSVQEVFGTQNLHLALLTYEQKFLDNRLDIEVGRTVANVAFLASPIYCNFQTNSTCGNPTLIFKDSNFTYFPAVSWGGHARYLLSDKVFFHIGAYEVNPQDKLPTDHGFTFSVAQATGVVIPYELGYATDFSNDDLPRHYGIGGWADIAKYSDPFTDAAGNPAVLSGQPYATRFGRTGLYARFDQTIWRPDPDTQQNLTVFGVFMANTSGRVQEDFFYELGLLQTGTFAGRNTDTIGFLVNDQVFSNLFLNNIIAARTSVGGTPFIPRHQIMMELNYGYQLTPFVRVMPNLQYIINPDQNSQPFRTTNIPDAFVIGTKFTVDISGMASYTARP